MKIGVKLVFLPLFLSLVLWTGAAMAGEAGKVTCSSPDCGYHENLKIGGGRKTPAVTGYCASTQQFVRLNIKSYDDYYKTFYCPGTKEPMQPIYNGSQVSEIPCPQCGNLTLHYTRTVMFD